MLSKVAYARYAIGLNNHQLRDLRLTTITLRALYVAYSVNVATKHSAVLAIILIFCEKPPNIYAVESGNVEMEDWSSQVRGLRVSSFFAEASHCDHAV
jgi:hypothetical protein